MAADEKEGNSEKQLALVETLLNEQREFNKSLSSDIQRLLGVRQLDRLGDWETQRESAQNTKYEDQKQKDTQTETQTRQIFVKRLT